MARSISQTLIRTTTTSASTTSSAVTISKSFLISAAKPPTNAARFLSIRTKYAIPNDSINNDGVDVEAMAVKRIEDAIHRMIVRKSVPDWLPFVPGGSYWVPPKRHLDGLPVLVNTIVNALTIEEYLSLTNVRGWPSSTFYSSEADTSSTSKTFANEASEGEGSEDEGVTK